MAEQASRWITLPAALLLVLGAGAAWALAALLLRSEASFMAAPAALAAVVGTGWTRPRSRAIAAVAAIALTLAAAAYALYLWSAALVAGGTGVDFIDALRQTGPGLAAAMIEPRLAAVDRGLIVGSAIGAAVVAAVRTRRMR